MVYELLKDNKQVIKQLVKIGVVDPVWVRDIEMFEEFQNLNIKCVMCKYSILADRYGISEESVRKRINLLKNS